MSNTPRSKNTDSELIEKINLDYPTLDKELIHKSIISLRLRGLLK